MKKYLLTASVALAAVACLTACDDSSSSSSNSIPEYKTAANLPDSCEMEIAKVDTAYFACFDNKWVEVTDSATIEQFKEGLDEKELKKQLEKLEEKLEAAAAAAKKPSSSSKKEEASDNEGGVEPESSAAADEEECTGRHCKDKSSSSKKSDDEEGSGSGSGSGKSSSSAGGSSTGVEGPAGLSFLNSGVTWTKAESQDCPITLDFPCKEAFHYEATITDESITRKFAENGMTGFSAKNLLEEAPAAQVAAIEAVMQIGKLQESDSLFSSSADSPILEGEDYTLYNVVRRGLNLYVYRQVLDMTGTVTPSSSSSSGTSIGESSSSVEVSSSSTEVSSSSIQESSSSEVESSSGCTDPAPNTTGRPDAVSFLDDYLNWYFDSDIKGTFKCGVKSAQVVSAVTGEGYGCIDVTKGKGKQEQTWKKCTKTIGSSKYTIEIYSAGGLKPTFPVTVTVKPTSSAGRPEAFSFLDDYVVEWLSDKEATYVVKAADQMAAALAENGYRERTLTDEMLLTLREEFEFKMDASNAVVYVKLERKTDGKITVMVLYIVVYTTDGYLGVMIDEGSSS